MKTITSTKADDLKERRRASVDTPTNLSVEATRDIAGAMNAILADVFALYSEDQELSLAHERATLSRLSPDV
jgi:hypothetical protein